MPARRWPVGPVDARQLRPGGRFPGRSAVGLAAVVAAATGFAVLLVLVRVHWQPLDEADRGISDALNRAVAGREPVVKVLEWLTGLGGNGVIWWLVTVGAACLLIRRRWQLAAYVVVVGAGALLLTPMVKSLVDRLRPEPPVTSTAAAGSSFPSGHTLNATVFCGALVLVLLPAVPPRLRRWCI